MKHNIQAYIYRGGKYYVAECTNINVVTQGRTLDETLANLQEAISLHIEGEDLAELGLIENPKLIVIMDLGEVNKKRESLRGIWKESIIDESLFDEARKSLFSYEE